MALTSFADVTLTGFPAFVVLFAVFYGPAILLLIIAAKAIRRAIHQRNMKRGTIVTEFKPPLDLSPAELGYLYDTKLQKQEIVATLLDLQQRGFITLKHGNLGLVAVAKKPPAGLKDHEAYLVRVINTGVAINYAFFSYHRVFVESNVQNLLVKRGFLHQPSIGRYFRRVAVLNFIGALIFPCSLLVVSSLKSEGVSVENVAALIATSTLFAGVFAMVLFPFYGAVSVATLWLYSRIAGKSWLRTDKLRKEWRTIEGYRQYVHMVEIDNIQFETTELKERSRNHALPYAVALGFSVAWKSQFEPNK